ncbi:MAG TPA: aldose epimerase family protein [Flexilinea sp.]|nr:galactose mutarotase [Flexilinea sp.]HQP46336.1 aldose epimerase family protein [Flexilinea sp.]
MRTFRMKNRNGIEVGFHSAGASIAYVLTPDRYGNFKNIALTLPEPKDYLNNEIYAGATVGPVAGRIKDGILPVLDQTYHLCRNEGNNTLHGGEKNFAHVIWNMTDFRENEDEASLRFSYTAPDGENGFPGNRKVSVEYILNRLNQLIISYTAETDKPTYLNITNHCYWNLSGDFNRDAYDHILKINADAVYYNDIQFLPTEYVDVKNSPFDFQTPRKIRDAFLNFPDHEQLKLNKGFNHAYLTKGDEAVFLSDNKSGRTLTISTDYPCVVFYSGGFLDQISGNENQRRPAVGSGLAFEAQYLPDAPQLMGDSLPILFPGMIYRKKIVFGFGTK